MLLIKKHSKIINKTQLRRIKSRRISCTAKTKQTGKK